MGKGTCEINPARVSSGISEVFEIVREACLRDITRASYIRVRGKGQLNRRKEYWVVNLRLASQCPKSQLDGRV